VDPLAPSGEAFDSVLNKGFPFFEVPGDIPVSGAGDKLIEDGFIINLFFHIVIDGEALGGEGLAADLAPESFDRSEGFGMIETNGKEPLFGGRIIETGALRIGAVWRDHL
jgi:hypothetical protein